MAADYSLLVDVHEDHSGYLDEGDDEGAQCNRAHVVLHQTHDALDDRTRQIALVLEVVPLQ